MTLPVGSVQRSERIARNARIDLLRGMAILAVLLLHFTLAYGITDSPLATLFSARLMRALAINGNFGVTIFFAISGYLITSNSLHRWGTLNAIDARAFYLLRLARIMPALLVALTIIVALGSVGLPFFSNTDGDHALPTSFFLLAVGSVLTFWHNVLMQSSGYFNYCLNIYWSLSVEEVFYLALPLLCLLLRRTVLLVAVCVALIVAGPIYRSAHLGNEIFFMYGYFACFDAIALGCLAALLARRWTLPERAARLLRVVSGLMLILVYLRGIDGHEVFGFSLIAGFSAAFLFAAASDTAVGWSGHRLASPVRWLGQQSYEIYLFHIIVLGLQRNFVTKENLSYATRLPWLAVFLVLTVAVAWAIANYVSEPANAALRKRFVRRINSKIISPARPTSTLP